MDKRKVLILIPAYNEEKNILGTINCIRESFPGAEIAVISDGSTDNTVFVARKAKTTVINHPVNLGDGAARQTGFRYALENNYDYVIQVDADGQHNSADIPKILDELQRGDSDVIVGSRFLGQSHYDIPALRFLGMKVFSFIILLTTGRLITDPTSGFRGLNRRAMDFYAYSFYPEHYPDADVIIASHYAGLRIKEIPVNMHNRKYGKSLHSGLSPVYYIYKMCLSIFTALFYRYDGGKHAG